MIKTDMSPEAITRRLRQAFELRRLCLELGKARPAPEANRPAEPCDHPPVRSERNKK